MIITHISCGVMYLINGEVIQRCCLKYKFLVQLNDMYVNGLYNN